MKNITFLTGLPRAGNTLFSSLLNQNKNIVATPNSIVPDLLHESFRCKHNITYQNFKGCLTYLYNIIKLPGVPHGPLSIIKSLLKDS